MSFELIEVVGQTVPEDRAAIERMSVQQQSLPHRALAAARRVAAEVRTQTNSDYRRYQDYVVANPDYRPVGAMTREQAEGLGLCLPASIYTALEGRGTEVDPEAIEAVRRLSPALREALLEEMRMTGGTPHALAPYLQSNNYDAEVNHASPSLPSAPTAHLNEG